MRKAVLSPMFSLIARKVDHVRQSWKEHLFSIVPPFSGLIAGPSVLKAPVRSVKLLIFGNTRSYLCSLSICYIPILENRVGHLGKLRNGEICTYGSLL